MILSKLPHFKISGSVLKLLAVFSMLVDHVGMFVCRGNEVFQQVICTLGSREITPYFLMRVFGRLAFPIFAFLKVLYIHGTVSNMAVTCLCLPCCPKFRGI